MQCLSEKSASDPPTEKSFIHKIYVCTKEECSKNDDKRFNETFPNFKKKNEFFCDEFIFWVEKNFDLLKWYVCFRRVLQVCL